jgi:mycoredoxin
VEILLYSAFWCSDCRVAKRFLQRHNVPFKEIDIEATPGAAEEVIARTGKRSIPQLVVNGKWFQPYRQGEGFLCDEVAELLGLDTP